MSPQVHLDRQGICANPARMFICLFTGLSFFLAACNQIEKPNTNVFYAATEPPPKQEFRWSNGKAPKSFDPALAAAPPETDIVRAVYEGLTELDSKTLKPIPGVAEKWSSSDDFRIWTFQLRKDAKWSNVEPVTANDFVRSWKRLADLGEAVAHRELLANIEGFSQSKTPPAGTPTESPRLISPQTSSPTVPLFNESPRPARQIENQNSAVRKSEAEQSAAPDENARSDKKKTEIKIGVEAAEDFVLKVTLIKPDPDFPSLVAHPIFRPVFGDGQNFAKKELQTDIVTNGAFKISGIAPDGITLDRSDGYWNKSAVKLERVRFVFFESAEKALAAYRSGEIDALTNADFEPLALKLLAPFEDFRQTTHAALNFYEFNLSKPPFNDRRVREALAIAIDRGRLTEGEMKGSTQPALNFFPFNDEVNGGLQQDVEKAQELLENAGFPDGEDFPTIRLLINRNDTQQRIARAVAKMWKENLNIDTDIVVKETADIDAESKSGNYDLVRRGLVFPTTDVVANLTMLFEDENQPVKDVKEVSNERQNKSKTENEKSGPAPKLEPEVETPLETPALTAATAIFDLRAIPLYFPTSYSLVKPYVKGFEINSLDAPTLKDVVIDYGWQPKASKNES